MFIIAIPYGCSTAKIALWNDPLLYRWMYGLNGLLFSEEMVKESRIRMCDYMRLGMVGVVWIDAPQWTTV